MSYLDIETDDPDFLADLQTARIEGIAISRGMRAATDTTAHCIALVTVEFVREIAIPVFVAWLSNRLINKHGHKTTIGDIDITKNSGDIRVTIENHIYGAQREPPKKEEQ